MKKKILLLAASSHTVFTVKSRNYDIPFSRIFPFFHDQDPLPGFSRPGNKIYVLNSTTFQS